MNKVILLGRLTKEPEIKFCNNEKQTKVANYTLAIDRGYGDNKETDFINCRTFAKAADFAEKYLTKGQQILVAGSLRIDNYKDNNGNNKSFAYVLVNEHYFTGSRNENTPKPAERPVMQEITEDEDLPF